MSQWPDPKEARELRDRVSDTFCVKRESVKCLAVPYRVCPVGAHVDHQGGIVSGFTIDQGILLAFFPSKEVNLVSNVFESAACFSLDEVLANPASRSGDWGDYVRGAAFALLSSGFILKKGITGMIESPTNMHGCGVSSSASLGCAVLLALEAANNLEVDPMKNVILDSQIENGYLGLKNGIMDPAIIMLSKKGNLTVVDCEKNAFKLVPRAIGTTGVPFKVLLVFSGIVGSLTGTAFNKRVEECQSAARKLLGALGRDAGNDARFCMLPEHSFLVHADKLSELERKRAIHYFGECNRVRAGLRYWAQGNWEALGSTMFDSCASSVVHYECGTEPLMELVKILKACPGVFGARFSGAGFRGCCLALVDPGEAYNIAAETLKRYRDRFPQYKDKSHVLIAEEGNGARMITFDDC